MMGGVVLSRPSLFLYPVKDGIGTKYEWKVDFNFYSAALKNFHVLEVQANS